MATGLRQCGMSNVATLCGGWRGARRSRRGPPRGGLALPLGLGGGGGGTPWPRGTSGGAPRAPELGAQARRFPAAPRIVVFFNQER